MLLSDVVGQSNSGYTRRVEKYTTRSFQKSTNITKIGQCKC
jgi:hypothetical protein